VSDGRGGGGEREGTEKRGTTYFRETRLDKDREGGKREKKGGKVADRVRAGKKETGMGAGKGGRQGQSG
jgi:hypothetical protein